MLKEKKISYHLVQFVQTTKLKKNKTWASFMINTDVCAVTTDKPRHLARPYLFDNPYY